MAGTGNYSQRRHETNFFVYNENETSLSELEEAVRGFLNKENIAILLIVQYLAEKVRHVLDSFDRKLPAIIEIPNKDHQYNPDRDSILLAAKVLSFISFII